MNTNHIILCLVAFCVALFIMLLLQRAMDARKYEALQEVLFEEQTLRTVETNINKVIFARKNEEIIKLKRQLAASEKKCKELSEKNWEEEALR